MKDKITQYEIIDAVVGGILIGAYEMYGGRSVAGSIISPAVLLMSVGRLALSQFDLFTKYVQYGLYFVSAVLASGIPLGSMLERPADLVMPAVVAVVLVYAIPYLQSMISSELNKK
jgi:hypothetical protein